MIGRERVVVGWLEFYFGGFIVLWGRVGLFVGRVFFSFVVGIWDMGKIGYFFFLGRNLDFFY